MAVGIGIGLAASPFERTRDFLAWIDLPEAGDLDSFRQAAADAMEQARRLAVEALPAVHGIEAPS